MGILKKGLPILSLMLVLALVSTLLPTELRAVSEDAAAPTTQTASEDVTVTQNVCDCTGTVPENIAHHADSCPRKQYIKQLFLEKTAEQIYGQWALYDEATRTDIMNMVSAWDSAKHAKLVDLLEDVKLEPQVVEATVGEIKGTASGKMPAGTKLVISDGARSLSTDELGLGASQGELITMLDLHLEYENAQWQPLDGGIAISLRLDLSGYNPETHYLFAIHGAEREIDGQSQVDYEYFTYGGSSNTLDYDAEAGTVTFTLESFSPVYFATTPRDPVSTDPAEPRYTDGKGTFWKFTSMANVFAAAGNGGINYPTPDIMTVSIQNASFTDASFSADSNMLSSCNAGAITIKFINCTFDLKAEKAGFKTSSSTQRGVALHFEGCEFSNNGIYGEVNGSYNVDLTFISCEAPNGALFGGEAGDVYMKDCLSGSGIHAECPGGLNALQTGLASFIMENCRFTEEVMYRHWYEAIHLNLWQTCSINNDSEYAFHYYERSEDRINYYGQKGYLYRKVNSSGTTAKVSWEFQHPQLSTVIAFTSPRIKYVRNGWDGDTVVAYSAAYAPGGAYTIDKNTFTLTKEVNGIEYNFVFSHWNTKPDGSGTRYTPNDSTPAGSFTAPSGLVYPGGDSTLGELTVEPEITLYAQWTQGEPILRETTLTIQVTGNAEEFALDPEQSYLFTVTGDDGVNMKVVVPAGKTVTIHGATIGATYTVIMDTAWAWRYGIAAEEAKIKIPLAASGNAFVFNVTRSQAQWLDGNDYFPG